MREIYEKTGFFRVPKVGAIAGCYVRNGVITRNSKVRFLREGVQRCAELRLRIPAQDQVIGFA